MRVRAGVLIRFIALYSALYGGFGIASPFLPPFLAARGIAPETLGLLLAAATGVRILSGTLAGRLADMLHAFRAELSLFCALAALAALFYLPAHGFWPLALASMMHAAMLAPLVPLSDALALAAARTGRDETTGSFEYGWVRGAGSAAFICGTVLAGAAVSRYGLACIFWLSAGFLVAAALAARLVPPLRTSRLASSEGASFGKGWFVLLRHKAFVRVIIVAALVLGSHAMHDSFVMIRWRDAGISSQITSLIWSESVASEVLVFFFVGPFLLRRIGSVAALALAASAGFVRWAVLASTAQVAVLAVVEPLHGLTFALLHLACMRIIAVSVPRELAGTAQALYGLVGIGGATLLITALSGALYAHFGAAGFWAMSGLCMGALPAIWSLRGSLRPPQIRPNAAAEGCYSNT